MDKDARIVELERCLDGGTDCADDKLILRARVTELEKTLAETLEYIDQDSETPTEKMHEWFAVLAGAAPAPFAPQSDGENGEPKP
jgi:hypothetical protein